MADMEKTVAANEYNAAEIQVLEGLEAVRKRPGMYIGSTSASGLHHLVYEIVDNSIDEALAGHCTDITVTINPGNTITVTDNGRGIPVDVQPQTGIAAFSILPELSCRFPVHFAISLFRVKKTAIYVPSDISLIWRKKGMSICCPFSINGLVIRATARK